jgi:hypothetical protein
LFLAELPDVLRHCLEEAVAREQAVHKQVKKALKADRIASLHSQADELQLLLESGRVAEVFKRANQMCGT